MPKKSKLSKHVFTITEYNPATYRNFRGDRPGELGSQPPAFPPKGAIANSKNYRDIGNDRPGVVGSSPRDIHRDAIQEPIPSPLRGAGATTPPINRTASKPPPLPQTSLQKSPSNNIPPTREDLPFAKTAKPTPLGHGQERQRWNNQGSNEEANLSPEEKMKTVINFTAEKLASLTTNLINQPLKERLVSYKQMVESILNFYSQLAFYAKKPEHKQIFKTAADALTAAYKQIPG